MQHALEFEVRLELSRVHVVFLQAYLFGVEVPVPALDRTRAHSGLDVGCLVAGIAHCSWCDSAQHLVNIGWVACGALAKHVFGVRLEAEQFGALCAQVHKLFDDRTNVVFVVAAALDK